MDKTLQFFMFFFCLSVVNVGGRGGGGRYLDFSGRPSVCYIISKTGFFQWKPRLKTNTEININNLIPDLIKIHACVYRYWALGPWASAVYHSHHGLYRFPYNVYTHILDFFLLILLKGQKTHTESYETFQNRGWEINRYIKWQRSFPSFTIQLSYSKRSFTTYVFVSSLT